MEIKEIKDKQKIEIKDLFDKLWKRFDPKYDKQLINLLCEKEKSDGLSSILLCVGEYERMIDAYGNEIFDRHPNQKREELLNRYDKFACKILTTTKYFARNGYLKKAN